MADDDDRTVWVQVGARSKVRCLLPEPHSVGWPFTVAMLDAITRDVGSVLITGETAQVRNCLPDICTTRAVARAGHT